MKGSTVAIVLLGAGVVFLVISLVRAKEAAPAPKDPLTAGFEFGTAALGFFGSRNNTTSPSTQPISLDQLKAM